MSLRTLLLGIVGGVCVGWLLAIPLLITIPAAFAADLPQLDTLPAILAGGAAILIMPATGFFAARWERAKQRTQGARIGAAAGALSGSVAWLRVGPAAAGILGHAPIWIHGPQPAASEQLAVQIVVECIVGTTGWHYAIFWTVMLGSALLGMFGGQLGGYLSPVGRGRTVRFLPLQVWKMVAASAMITLMPILFFMPGVYTLLAQRSDELLARATLPSTLPPSWALDLPRATIYLALVIVVRWAWHLVALERSHIAPASQNRAFLILTALFPILVVALAFLLNPNLMSTPMAWIWCAGLLLSTLSGGIHTFRSLPPLSDRHLEPPVVWHDWLSAMIICAVISATLVQLLVIGVGLSLVMGTIVFIGVLFGTEPGAVPTVAEAITTLISMQQITIIVGAAIPLLLLPLFLLYVWIRGKRESPVPAPSPF